MGAKADILFDKTEIIVQIAAKQAMSIPMRAEDIMSIAFHPTKEKTGFLGTKTVESEVVLIKPKKMPFPMAVTKLMIEDNKKTKTTWEDIKTGMEKFAKDNKISLSHETDEWEPPKFDRLGGA